MKIDDPLRGISAVRTPATRRQKGNTRAPASVGGNAIDSVDITPTSAQLSQLEEALGQIDGTDTGKVEAVRQAIAEGRFQVNEEVVADALAKSTMEQLRRRGKVER